MYIVVGRYRAGPNHPETGWLVAEASDAERQEMKRMLGEAGVPLPFEVSTAVLDRNWVGPVWVGGKVIPVPSAEADIPKYACTHPDL